MARRGIHKGAPALLWGEPRFVRRGGNPSRPGFPLGGNGKGGGDSLPPQADSAPRACSRQAFHAGFASTWKPFIHWLPGGGT